MDTAVASTCGYGHQMGAGAYVCPQCGAPPLARYLPVPSTPATISAAPAMTTPQPAVATHATGHALAVIGLVCSLVTLLAMPVFGPRLLVPALLGLVCAAAARARGAALAPVAVVVSATAVCAPFLPELLRQLTTRL
jgi:hypothetical protein